MVHMGGSKHLKRFAAPGVWPIPVKRYTWAIKPLPGPHQTGLCIPLGMVLRDILKFGETLREVKFILNSGYIRVDGIVRREYKFPVGMMDVISVLKLNKHYRIVPSSGGMKLIEIPVEDADKKIVKVTRKKTTKGGKIQLGTNDGRSILLDETQEIKRGDSLLIRIPEQEILEHLPLAEGNVAVFYRGKNAGTVGEIVEVSDLVKISCDGQIYSGLRDYIMVVGRDKPLIKVDGA
uniref:Small ribosomal subunit protein eS4 n=1 Tax=uncultured korarchaeote TaxID=161241 RepID=A0A1L2JK82_9CREN|nr:ribosomal protein S4E [uncultured korarchaeote]